MKIKIAGASLGVAVFGCMMVSPCAMADGAQITPFTEEAVARGVVYLVQEWNGPTGQGQGFGCAIADINGNGHQDIVVMGNGQGIIGVFENDGTGHFIDRTNTSGIPAMTKPSGIALADFNGNGMLDIYISQQFNAGSYLMRNEGDFTFVDVTAAAGVANIGHGEGAAWGDYDNDGWLDLYLVNYTFPSQQYELQKRNQLFRNLGDETFSSVGHALGVDDHGMGFSVVWSDINRNGRLDLHVVNDRGHLPPMYRTNQLWRNEGGTFNNISASSGANLGLWSMGVAAGDFSGNGYPDFYITNLPNIGGYNGINPLLINQGDETFVDETVKAGTSQFIFSWAAMFFDFNNSSHLDLYVCNMASPNALFANDGTYPTTNVNFQAGVVGSAGYSFNAAYGDITGNGALDLLLNDYGSLSLPGNVQLFINHEGTKRNWIRYNVVGFDGNLRAIGANIDTRTGDRWQWREIYAGGNNMKGQNELVFHVGLDDATVADEIVVNWPGGEVTRTLYNYPANHVWTIYPPQRLGDSNNDGIVDRVDLEFLLDSWGTVNPGAEMMDINGDGVIDVSDLLQLLAAWSGVADPPPPPRGPRR